MPPYLAFICLGVWLLLSWSPAFAETELQQAIDVYTAAMELDERDRRLAQFARSEQLFAQAINERRTQGKDVGADLLANWGNAALQAEHLGKAILAYRQALAVDPDHQLARQNLNFARSTLPEWSQQEAVSSVVDTLFFWRAMLSSSQVAGLAGCVFFLAAMLIAIGILLKSPSWRNIAFFPLVVWLVLLASLTIPSREGASNAVVVADGTLLYSADSENSPLRLSEPLPDGTELEVIERRERWSEVRISGRTGWVRSSALATIRQDYSG